MKATNYLMRLLQRRILPAVEEQLVESILRKVKETADIDPEQQDWVLTVLIKKALETGEETPSSIANYINEAVPM